jgi:hypothetical protein
MKENIEKIELFVMYAIVVGIVVLILSFFIKEHKKTQV